MQLNVIVDVVIGLVVLFWIVATSASFVVEAISSFLNVRGHALEKYVRDMIWGNSAVRGWLDAVRRPAVKERPGIPVGGAGSGTHEAERRQLDVNDHPLIRRLAKPATNYRGEDTAPSYIPADLFAKALIDRMRQIYGALLTACDVADAFHEYLPPAVSADVAGWLRTLSNPDLKARLKDLLVQIASRTDAIVRIDSALTALHGGSAPARVLRIVRQPLRAALQGPINPLGGVVDVPALIDTLWPEIEAALAGRTLGVADLQAIVASGRLPAALAAALKPLLDAANHDIEVFRESLESWFDSVMDRASGWFRRRTQWWLGAVALVMAVLLNLDAIYIGQHLVADREARDAAVRMGQTVVAQGDNASALPQTYLFRERFKDGAWAQRLMDGPEALAAADALARQVQPMLLVSGRYVEPMLALQAAALAIAGRCARTNANAGTPCTPDDRAKHWKDLAPTREALVAGLCRVALSASTASRDDRDWAARSTDTELLADAGREESRKRCAGSQKLVPADAKETKEVVAKLWREGPRKADGEGKNKAGGEGKVVWDATLAHAAWEVRLAAAVGENKPEAVARFRDAMDTALEEARKQLQAADELLARMPYVGSAAKALERWQLPGMNGWDRLLSVILSLIGWFVTAFMASLGAPMWFDLLNKLVNRRISGPKPESGAAAQT